MGHKKRSNEPFLWLLFSAGGVVAAMLIPIHLFLFGLAFPLGWLNGPSYQNLLAEAGITDDLRSCQGIAVRTRCGGFRQCRHRGMA